MSREVNLDNIAVILVEAQIPENIGSVARAMHNMGARRLILVAPRNCDLCRVLKTATGTSIDVVEEMERYDDLSQALGQFEYVVGTTARVGSKRPAFIGPRSLAQELIAISQNNRIALLFGPEDRGLSNDQLKYCHTITRIPTAHFSSLNLAQAVMILCYELFLARMDAPQETIPRLANTFELEGMYEHAQKILTKIGFLNPQNPEHWMLNIRRLCARLSLKAKEVRTIRGICRQIDWYTDQVEKHGHTKK